MMMLCADGGGEQVKSAVETIEGLKVRHETMVQWLYRKKFMLHYSNDYPIEQLECWSKILSNAKFYGCSYNAAVTERLNDMLEQMGEERIQSRNTGE